MQGESRSRNRVNHTLDTTPGVDVRTGCGLDVRQIIAAARRGDRFTLELVGMEQRVPEDACPRCVRDHVRWIGALVRRDKRAAADGFRSRMPGGFA